VSRAQVKADVLQARVAGDLQPAGEGTPQDRVYAQAISAPSTLARANVKADVLEARANGQLIPAGEGSYPNETEARHVALTPARSSNLFAFLHRSH
jgi:hypothetical protein